MTEALIKPIKLGKESNELIAKAFSKENLQRVRDYEKNVRPKYESAPNRKNKMSIEELMEAYK